MFKEINDLKRILLLFFLFSLPIIFISPVQTLSQETGKGANVSIPNDFRITLISAPLMPGSKAPALKLSIERNGAGKYYEKWKGAKDFELKKSFTLNEKALKEIYGIVLKERFFELKKEYRDPDVKDGDYAFMEITSNKKTWSVRTVNIKVGAFDRIFWKVNLLLPKNISITYNALFAKDYRKVER